MNSSRNKWTKNRNNYNTNKFKFKRSNKKSHETRKTKTTLNIKWYKFSSIKCIKVMLKRFTIYMFRNSVINDHFICVLIRIGYRCDFSFAFNVAVVVAIFWLLYNMRDFVLVACSNLSFSLTYFKFVKLASRKKKKNKNWREKKKQNEIQWIIYEVSEAVMCVHALSHWIWSTTFATW